MIIRDVQVDVGSLVDRSLVQADMVLRLVATDGAVRLVVRDASSGQFAGLSVSRTPGGWHPAGVVDEAVIAPFALSPDGSRLLLGNPDLGRNRLSLHTLATGAATILPPGPGDGANAAAFAPDGKRIAMLTSDDEAASVVVLDVDGGRVRELWSAEGGTHAGTVVSWSPDGGFLAVTYLDPDDSDHTVVVDGDGRLVADVPEMAIVGRSRLCWTSDHDLFVNYEFWGSPDVPRPVVLVDAATGERREIAQPWGLGVGSFGALDGRVLRLEDSRRVVSTAFDGSDPRPVLDVGPDHGITFMDARPGALG